MTIEQSPVTILGDLIEQLESEIDLYEISTSEALARAYAAGADQELEACCEWLHWQNLATHQDLIPSLRAARRPEPPSLKELALEALDQADKGLNEFEWQQRSDTIRRALESLPD